MTTRMLIDARHPEETRVAVLKGNRIDEFDFDSADHKQIKGNIYLAKVTRVEPSLQAAFVDFGGNRHGFLAFGEIHPDYYQIPREDREALLAEEAAHAEEEAALRGLADDDEDYDDADQDRDDFDRDAGDLDDDDNGDDGNGGVTEVDTSEKDEVATIEAGHVDGFDEGDGAGDEGAPRRGRRRQGQGRGDQRRGGRAKQADDLRDKRMALRRRYKIQDVIHRRQVLLVQVNKEERGNKGAALTTYLSLAGRYCVLMPNSSHGGGISRKISSVADRKRLKSIIAEMDLPKTMGCIVRTAGLARTKPEIKRDFDYLARLWDGIRETTLGSSAPALIHSDSDLIKRAIRDIYNNEIEDIVVEGEAGYRDAREFMKLLMPSHARRVKAYVDPVPLFQRYGAEDQLSALYDPVVQLKSGGYLVINPTEALVSIDINSGRSTKEHGIEATAVNTNLEAAREIARQLRLRDMAGLVVIDFIDMEHGSNVRKVEKAMKDALKDDRARIQVGRISSFGLMEMSRQRLRTGVLEATTRFCPHCDGTGLVRTAASSGLAALRLIEEEAARGKGTVVTLFASQEASIYVLNAKRGDLAEIEARYGVTVEVIPEGENEGAKMRVASSGPRNDFAPRMETIALVEDDEPVEEEFYDEEDAGEDGERQSAGDDDGEGGRTRKRRKRRRGRSRDGREDGATAQQGGDGDEAAISEGDEDHTGPRDDAAGDDGDMTADGQRKRRRRRSRRRGGRGRDEAGTVEAGEVEDAPAEGEEAPAPVEVAEPEPVAKPKRTRRTKVQIAEEAAAVANADEGAAEEAPAAPEAEPAPAKPRRARSRKAAEAEVASEAETDAAVEAKPAKSPAKPRTSRAKKPAVDAPAPADSATVDEPAAALPDAAASPDAPAAGAAEGEQRRGWWQRTFGE